MTMTNTSSSTISGRKDEEEGTNNKNNIHTFLQRYGTSTHDEETVAAGMVVSQSRLHANVIRSGISKTKGSYRNQRRSSRRSPRGSYPTSFRIDPTGSIVGATSASCSSNNNDSTTSSFEAEEELDKILSTDIISSSNDSIYPEKTIQQQQPKQQQQQQQQQLQKSLEDDSVFDFGSMSSNSKTDPDDSNISPDPILEASRIEDEEDDRSSVVIKLGEPGGSPTPEAKISEKEDSLCSFLKRSRCTLFALFLGCLMMIGLAFGICLLFLDLPITINSNSTEESPSSSSTSSSSSSPSSSQQYFNQVGSSLDGIVVEGRFGSSLTLNGNGKRMAVADIEDVYVYDLQVDDVTGVIDWLYTGIINAPPEATVDRNIQFHDVVQNTVHVDMSQDGNHLVVGWPYSRNEDGSELRVGSVQVYQYDDERGWKVVGNVLYGSKSEDYFGASVSISSDGRFVGVGSPGNLGQADVFELVDVNDDEKIWTQYGDITGQLDGSLAVGSISMSSTGQVVAVGGYPYIIRGGVEEEGNDDVDGATAVVRIFRFVAGNWIELGLGISGNFFLEDTAYNAELSANGRIVALSNYYVGDFNPTEDGLNDALDVRVYEWVGNAWIQMGGNIHAFEPGDKSGYYASLSNDGKTIFVGDPGRRSTEDGDETGHVHLYEYNDVLQRWEENRPNVYGEFSGDQFGSAVAMSGDGKHFAASAPYNQGKGIEFGRVYVFEDG